MIGGILGFVTLALAATETLAGKTVDDVKKNLPKSDGNEGSYSNSGTKHVSASIECSSSAWASASSSKKDVWIKYTKKLVKKACKWKGVNKVKKVAKKLGGLWIDVSAHATAECESKVSGGGKASGCAVAKASAKAWETAYLDVHVKAIAEAQADYCGCTNAASWSFGEAGFWVTLMGDAYAKAEAAACAEGNEESSASAWANCWVDIIADVYTKAVAKAVIDGHCYDKHAYTEIKAVADADISYSEGCYLDEDYEGTAGADASGGTNIKITTH